ncbi:TIGR04551 family protein [Persicimonas caeni]|uniref:TIGR04551 family protein n=1 Tax=Persicimonas caeni TaxID=2292766 RepID=A0A4Y6PR66_PERCE|nr:TIGR04551 family protein [Persicimonas caeni]QDG50275.1 TIGR04551 family protein [Persicimonas caeni]QED31496.1 TIGR04551 family protein [Persicimonas caeni]
MKRLLITLLVLSMTTPAAAAESDLARTGQDLREHPDTELEFDGYFRTRGEAFFNLDLDRGPTPSGQYLYPLPLGNPRSQWLTGADMRLRTDLSLYALNGTAAVKVRIDVLDNLPFGSTPNGNPLTTTSQNSPGTAFQLKRAYGEVLTPFGVLLAGRMGAHWGLGMLANGGDCASCDTGDAADRVAFISPIAGHLWAAAYDIAYAGPTTSRTLEDRALDLDPSDDVHAITFASMRWRSPLARERRLRADMATIDYGGTFSYRWQQNDVPASWLDTNEDVELDPRQVMERDFRSWVFDGWMRVLHPWMRLEFEAAYLIAEIGQPSSIPGFQLNEPITSQQYGFAFESDFGPWDGDFTGGLDAGVASGDSAPGFGSTLGLEGDQPVAGDLDGPQANPPRDNQINNFLFHPDYHVDRILFREIIGTVTDAMYLRPHVAWRFAELGPGSFTASMAATASWAVNVQSTPGNAKHLGVELDPSLLYRHEDGFSLSVDYAVLFPGKGLSNPDLELSATPAQLFRARVIYGF